MILDLDTLTMLRKEAKAALEAMPPAPASAVRLKLRETLGGAPATRQEIARKTGLDAEATAQAVRMFKNLLGDAEAGTSIKEMVFGG